MKAAGSQQLPPGQIDPSDVAWFMDKYADPAQAVSIYALEASSGSVLDMLRKRAAAMRIGPAEPPHGDSVIAPLAASMLAHDASRGDA